MAALLDVARTVVRRAERHALVAAEPPSLVVTYLNRLSDLLWTLARWQEGHSLSSRQYGRVSWPSPSTPPSPGRATADVVGIPFTADGPVPRGGLVARSELGALGFTRQAGHDRGGARSRSTSASAIARAVTPAALRTAAAALARAVDRTSASVATALADVDGVDPRAAAQAVAEGFVLGSYRYLALKRKRHAVGGRAGRAAGSGAVGRRPGRRRRARAPPSPAP